MLYLTILTPGLNAQTQTLVNKVWSISNGNPASGLEWSASKSDIAGNIYTVGNTVDNNLNVNLLVTTKN